jgi:hypothetical protein
MDADLDVHSTEFGLMVPRSSCRFRVLDPPLEQSYGNRVFRSRLGR